MISYFVNNFLQLINNNKINSFGRLTLTTYVKIKVMGYRFPYLSNCYLLNIRRV